MPEDALSFLFTPPCLIEKARENRGHLKLLRFSRAFETERDAAAINTLGLATLSLMSQHQGGHRLSLPKGVYSLRYFVETTGLTDHRMTIPSRRARVGTAQAQRGPTHVDRVGTAQLAIVALSLQAPVVEPM